MEYKIVLTKQAKVDLDGLDIETGKRIVQKLVWWQKQKDILKQAKTLKESKAGDLRFRVGDYRLIAIINGAQKRIEVVKIGHRREIYR